MFNCIAKEKDKEFSSKPSLELWDVFVTHLFFFYFIYVFISFLFCLVNFIIKHFRNIFVSPALAGKRHKEITLSTFVVFLLLLLWKHVNIWLYRPHTSMDFNQSWVIDATWEPSFVDEVKGYISRSKVIWGQVVRCENESETENVKVASFEKLKSDWNQTWFIDIIWESSMGNLRIFMRSKLIYLGQRSSEVNLQDNLKM